MKFGTLCRLSSDSIYLSRDHHGLTVIVMEEGNPASGFYCFVVEKSEKLWFFNYQLDDAEVLSQ